MSTMKEQHAWHIQNLLEVDDDCMVVLLSAAEHLEAKYAAVCAELEELQNSLPKLKADVIRSLEEEVNDGQIKVKVSIAPCLFDWVDAGVWLLNKAEEMEQGQ